MQRNRLKRVKRLYHRRLATVQKIERVMPHHFELGIVASWYLRELISFLVNPRQSDLFSFSELMAQDHLLMAQAISLKAA